MGTATNFVVFDKSFQAASLGDASLIAIVATIQVLLNAIEELLRRNRKERRRSNGYIKRKRRSLVSIRNEYGNLFERAYRMDYPAFLELHELLKDGIEEYVRKEGTSRNSSANEPFYRKNGKITTQICLACALRYFAGRSYLDIIMSHSVGKTDFYRSIWAVVHATNQCSSLDFQFPSTLAECQSISNEFSLRSKAGFSNCIGCIDGLLIWMEKPSKDQCIEVGVDSGKFLCGRKGKFGLNLQGICDARRRFTYISIQHPASASDYLAFVTSSLYGRLTNVDTTLPNGYCLYGDNAYVNDTFMTVPYPMISSGPKDAYNFYHSQVRINIECAFGILVNRWRILKTPLSAKIPIVRINALVCCLCKLHNFCLDRGSATARERYAHDQLTLMDFMNAGESENPRPLGLLGGSEHFADVDGGQREAARLSRRRISLENVNPRGTSCPRTVMLQHVIELDIHRPRPFDTSI